MRYKTLEVEPYTHTYCAFNKHTGETYGDFDCLDEATNFAAAQPRRHNRQGAFSYTLKLEATQSYQRYVGRVYDGTGQYRWERSLGRSIYDTEYFPAPDWVIRDDLGDIVPEAEVKSVSGTMSLPQSRLGSSHRTLHPEGRPPDPHQGVRRQNQGKLRAGTLRLANGGLQQPHPWLPPCPRPPTRSARTRLTLTSTGGT